MEFLVPLLAVAMVFGMPLYFIKRRYDLKEKTLGSGGADRKELAALSEERRLLQERVENLETIVTNVDFDLNMRIAHLAAQSRLALAHPRTEQAPETEAAGTKQADEDHAAAAKSGDAHPVLASARTVTAPGSIQHKLQALREAAGNTCELEVGSLLADRYRVTGLLGRGGMGAVFRAEDEVLGEDVAVKVISSMWASQRAALGQRFRREVSSARKVSSPHVIRIHDLGETPDGLLYLSMEYFQGQTLAEVLATRGALDAATAGHILRQICAGVQAAHDAGVIHRDLKPGNTLVGAGDTVKIIDFGLAKTSFMGTMTATGLMVGTPHYMSPEQVRGKDIDARSDIYSLGAMAYHAVTGQPPFDGETPIAIGFAHCAEAPRPPRELAPGLTRELERMILRALEKDPKDRPNSASEFRGAL